MLLIILFFMPLAFRDIAIAKILIFSHTAKKYFVIRLNLRIFEIIEWRLVPVACVPQSTIAQRNNKRITNNLNIHKITLPEKSSTFYRMFWQNLYLSLGVVSTSSYKYKVYFRMNSFSL